MTEEQVLELISARRHELETPLYLYSVAALRTAADRLLSLLPDRAQLFYSLKANPQSAVVQQFWQMGVRPEIASAGERLMCDRAGISDHEILVGGVSKSIAYLADICHRGCYALVIDSMTEWTTP